MQTYLTIDEAFKKGSGDSFFQKGEEFIAISRHIDPNVMEEQGFTWLNYDQVVKLSLQLHTIDSAAVWVAGIKGREKYGTDRPQFINEQLHCNDRGLSYYDEFPDAYGQSL